MVDFSQVHEVKAATIGLMEELWKQNYRANQAKIRRAAGVLSLFDRLRNVPAVVVGAGPSLDKNIATLTAVQGRGIIIAVDTIYQHLIAVGIQPDFVITLDPQEIIVNFFSGDVVHHGFLVAPTIAHPHLLETWRGDLILYNKYAPDIPLLAQITKEAAHLGVLIPGGSVVTVGLDLAFRLGCDPIAFIGQDLSYPSGCATHASGSNYAEQSFDDIKEKKKGALLELPDIFGRMVQSEKAMAVTKEWMEWAFVNFKRNHPATYYNCTEGGVVTEGCRITSLREWVLHHCARRAKKNFAWNIKKNLGKKAKKKR